MKIYFAGDSASEDCQLNWLKFFKTRLISFFLITHPESWGGQYGRMESL
jgi:hypothetical protein